MSHLCFRYRNSHHKFEQQAACCTPYSEHKEPAISSSAEKRSPEERVLGRRYISRAPQSKWLDRSHTLRHTAFCGSLAYRICGAFNALFTVNIIFYIKNDGRDKSHRYCGHRILCYTDAFSADTSSRAAVFSMAERRSAISRDPICWWVSSSSLPRSHSCFMRLRSGMNF